MKFGLSVTPIATMTMILCGPWSKSTFLVHGQDQQEPQQNDDCLKQTFYSAAGDCTGESDVEYVPVGTNFDDSCAMVDLPDDMGTMAVATYCDIKGRLRVDCIVGIDDCTVSKNDDSVEYTQSSSYHGNKCINIGNDQSFMVECMIGSCPTYNDNDDANMIRSTGRRGLLLVNKDNIIARSAISSVVDPSSQSNKHRL